MLRVLLLLVLLLTASAARADGPENLSFEGDSPSKPPEGWFVPGPAADAGWTARVRANISQREGKCAALSKSAGRPGGSFGNLMQQFDASAYRGKRVVMTAWMRVKPDNVQAGGRAQMWFRVDREGDKPGFFNNCSENPCISPEWTQAKIIADIDADAAGIAIGFMSFGATVWVDDVAFDVVGDAVKVSDPPKEISTQGLQNLVAFAKLVGYVQYYCPSDEAAACDWEEFVRQMLPEIERAAGPAELLESLQGAFAPVAPAIRLQADPFPNAFDPKSMLSDTDKPGEVTAWSRYGYAAKGHAVYRDIRRDWPAAAQAPQYLPSLGDHKTAELAPGVWARIPLVLYRDAKGTLPAAITSRPLVGDAEYVRPSGDQRTTRLADVILAWNVFQHHYPYFDVVKVDWEKALVEGLREAATDVDASDFHNTLEKLVARLEDGHGYVGFGGAAAWARLPISWSLVGDRLIVTEVPPSVVGVSQGDEVLEIDGSPVAELAAAAAQRMSASTTQLRRYRTAADLLRGDMGQSRTLRLRSPDGTLSSKALTCGPSEKAAPEPRPEKIAEIRPGIWYVDIDRVRDADIVAAMDKLAAAEGLVFDLRGYPGALSTIVLAHLTDTELRSAHWCIPMLPRPDREGITFTDGGWPVIPAQPRWTKNAAFIIDGRAISYAETYMGIVEHFKLAEIVGEATAGTNGNVTSFSLPGGYSIGFTGMRVLKHDGSTHHGVGIKPTIPVERTIEGIAAGRDELLDAAVSHVDKNR